MRGKKLTVAQKKWLQAYGIKNTDPYLMQKNTPEMLQLKDNRTGDVIKFKKIIDGRCNVTLELMNDDKGV